MLLEVVGALEEFIELVVLVLDSLLVEVSLCLFLLEVVVDESEVALALHSHVDDLGELLLVLVLQNVDLLPGVVFNPLALFLVVFVHLIDLFLQAVGLLDLAIKLDLLVLLQLLNNLLVVESELVGAFLELASVFIFLSLQLVESLLVSVLLVSVVLLSALHANIVSLDGSSDLLIVVPLHFFFAVHEGVEAVVVFDLLVLDFSHQLSDLLVLAVHLLLHRGLFILLCIFNFVSKVLNIGLELVSFLLLDQNFLRLSDLGKVLLLFLRVFVLNLEHSEDSVLPSGEKVLVVVGDSEALDGETVSLNFENALEIEVDHLNGAGLIVFGNTSKESSSAVEHLDLRNISSSFVGHGELSAVYSLDSLVNSRSIHNRFGVGLVGNAGELEVFDHESVLRVDIFGIVGVAVELPNEDVSIPTSRNEARVVVHPVEASHRAQVSLVH